MRTAKQLAHEWVLKKHPELSRMTQIALELAMLAGFDAAQAMLRREEDSFKDVGRVAPTYPPSSGREWADFLEGMRGEGG